jgi:N-succinyl-L-ornithine transcarbamylase
MKYFTNVKDAGNVPELVAEAIQLKKNPYFTPLLGKNKMLGLIFMNPSLRTRLSTQKAALNLGMNVIVMNIDKDGWALELEDGSIMNESKVEHVKDAAAVMGLYCDIIGIRCFPSLQNREDDYNEKTLQQFIKYCNVPLVSLESATLHPLQSFADMITIEETKTIAKPKVVLTWAPHVKALPQAVGNSFAEWTLKNNYNLVITHPKGYELSDKFTQGATIEYNQQKAIEGADYVYVKNWSSYNDYGKILPVEGNWLLTKERMKASNEGKIMHCLPVRRNVELLDELIDSENSLVLRQAENRLYAAQTVLKKMLESNYGAKVGKAEYNLLNQQ